MDIIEKATVIHYHRHRIRTYSEGTAKALGWRGPESQTRRFEVLAGVGDLRGCSVLDVGCGHADLKAFLDRTAPDVTYLGLDQMPEFVTEAQARYQDDPRATILQADFTTATLPEVDYVLASGALAYRCSDPEFHLRMIERMWTVARRALGFNMLRKEVFPEHPLLVGHDLDQVVAFCKGLSGDVEVVEGYLDDDFTVFVRADGSTNPRIDMPSP